MASEEINVTLPANGWKPRPYQKRAWEAFEDGVSKLALIYHRRAGKDELAMRATVSEMHASKGSYYHCAPTTKQGRKIIWNAINPHTGNRRIFDALPKSIIHSMNGTEMHLRAKCGSQWYVTGSDNYDSLVGESGLGYVFSEWALCDPRAWAYLQPIIEENGGFVFFIYTPRGKNHGLSTYKALQADKDAFAEILTVEDTSVFSQKQLDDIQKNLMNVYGEQHGEALFQQEYYCSFDAAVFGTIYGEFIAKAEREGRVVYDKRLYSPLLPVMTAWDLGFDDSTAIWFFQEVGGEIRLIDFYEDFGRDVQFYADFLRQKQKERFFKYGAHFVPHDAAHELLAAGGKSIVEQFKEQGFLMTVLPATTHENYIQATRLVFPRFWFDGGRCDKGLERLRDYKYDFNEKKKTFSRKPAHDYASHAADAFKLIGQRYEFEKIEPKAQLSIQQKEYNQLYQPVITEARA